MYDSRTSEPLHRPFPFWEQAVLNLCDRRPHKHRGAVQKSLLWEGPLMAIVTSSSDPQGTHPHWRNCYLCGNHPWAESFSHIKPYFPVRQVTLTHSILYLIQLQRKLAGAQCLYMMSQCEKNNQWLYTHLIYKTDLPYGQVLTPYQMFCFFRGLFAPLSLAEGLQSQQVAQELCSSGWKVVPFLSVSRS